MWCGNSSTPPRAGSTPPSALVRPLGEDLAERGDDSVEVAMGVDGGVMAPEEGSCWSCIMFGAGDELLMRRGAGCGLSCDDGVEDRVVVRGRGDVASRCPEGEASILLEVVCGIQACKLKQCWEKAK